MTEFKTHESPKEKRYCLQFETDNRGYFLRVQTAAAECMDHKPLTNFERIKAMTVEEMAEFLQDLIPTTLIAFYETGYVVRKSAKEWLEREADNGEL